MAGVAPARQARLKDLRQQIARAGSFSTRSDETVSLGMAEVDICLNGGLARGALHEIAAADHRSTPAALGFLLAMTQCQKRLPAHPPPLGEEDRSSSRLQAEANILWPLAKTAPAFGLPYPPGLKFFGLDPTRIAFVRCANAREYLWAMEEGLRLGGIAAVIGARTKTMDLTASRRLQLVAEQANTPVFLLRNYNDHAPSAAATRWRVSPAPSARDQFDFYKNARFRVVLDDARGGKTGEWAMEWDHDALLLRLSSALGDRAAGENRAA
jgi:protein ImuA